MRKVAARSEGDIDTTGELLCGAPAIAAFLRISPRAVSSLIKDHGLPVAVVGWWKMSTKRLVLAWIESRAGRVADG
jgi:hypothetical protein